MNFISKYERNGFRACKVNVSRSGVTYFARDPLRSYFDERQKEKEIYFLKEVHNVVHVYFLVVAFVFFNHSSHKSSAYL